MSDLSPEYASNQAFSDHFNYRFSTWITAGHCQVAVSSEHQRTVIHSAPAAISQIAIIAIPNTAEVSIAPGFLKTVSLTGPAYVGALRLPASHRRTLSDFIGSVAAATMQA